MSRQIAELEVLCLDDCPFELDLIGEALGDGRGRDGYRFNLHGFSDVESFKVALEKLKPDIVLLDLYLKDDASALGTQLVGPTRQLAPGALIFVLSSTTNPNLVQSALDSAADDYVVKDRDPALVRERILASYEFVRAGRRGPPQHDAGYPQVAGETMRQIRGRVANIVSSAITGIHVSGESGTGKEVVAHLFRAAVAPKPFLSVNCGAIPASLLESTLFGVVKGSYTGASADRKGYLEAASGGWLFLDEIATLSASAQAALLRAIENQEVIRVGDNRPIKVDVRIISATNEDLRVLVEEGRFRLDLWQRLAEVELRLPPLRDRSREIHEMIDHIVAGLPGGPYRVTSSARALLCGMKWREGNVRQLRNCLRAMTEFQVDGILGAQAIPPNYRKDGEAPPEEDAVEPLPEPAPEPPPEAPPGPRAAGVVEIALLDEQGRLRSFERLTQALFVAVVRELAATSGRLTVRALERRLEISKSTVSRRLWDAIDDGLASVAELNESVTIGRRAQARGRMPL